MAAALRHEESFIRACMNGSKTHLEIYTLMAERSVYEQKFILHSCVLELRRVRQLFDLKLMIEFVTGKSVISILRGQELV